MSNPLSYPNLLITVAKMQKDIRDLQRRKLRSGATDLDGLDDGEVKYLHPTDAPQLDQAWRWDDAADLPQFGGIARFADPTIVADSFTEDITGAGSFLIDEDLVDGSWDVSRPCRVTVTGVFDANYASQEVSPPTTPATYVTPPTMFMVLSDGDGGAISTFGDGFERAVAIWPVEEDPSDSAALGHQAESVSWLFLRGTPHLTMWCEVGSGAAAGLSTSGGNQRITAVARVTRL